MRPVQAAIFGLVTIFFLYQIGGGVLQLLIFGTDFQNANINAVRFLTIGGQILFMLLPALVFTKLVYQDVTEIIRFRLPDLKSALLLIGGFIILIPLLQFFLYIQNYSFELLASKFQFLADIKEVFDWFDKQLGNLYVDLLTPGNAFEMVLVIFTAAVIPSICEEVFFRGYIQRSFEFKYSKLSAAIITGLFFGLYHVSPYGLIGLITIGFYLGFATYVSDSILVPVILHFLNNLTAVILFFIYGEDELNASIVPDATQIQNYIYFFIILLLLFIVFVYYTNKYYNNKEGVHHDLS